MEPVSLLKFLVEAGLGSRRTVVSAIKQGRVSVNRRVAESYTMPVYPQLDNIIYDSKPVHFKKVDKIVLMLNKPAGTLSATKDDRGRQTVMNLIPTRYLLPGLHPVGRLDYDTTGLIILTNDGNLTYRLTHPRFEHEKEYYVCIRETLTRENWEKLEKGIIIDESVTYPAQIKNLSGQPPYNYSITIHEGRNHQIRRMFAALGYEVKALKRQRMGGLQLGTLAEGEVIQLSENDIIKLLRQSV